MSPFTETSKKLIVSGCSYSDNCWTENNAYGFPVWPELLAKKLKMECVNLSKSGMGNEYIYSSILDTIPKHKNIGLVLPMWSEFLRLDFHVENLKVPRVEFESGWTPLAFPALNGKQDRHAQEWKNIMMKDLYMKGFGRNKANIKRSFRMFYMFQQTMKSLNIPFLQLIGTRPVDKGNFLNYNRSLDNDHSGKLFCHEIIDSPYLSLIDDNLFLGWPIMPQIGGWYIDSFLDEYEYEDVRISLDDCHPNAKGHKLISEKLYKYYENRYGTVF